MVGERRKEKAMSLMEILSEVNIFLLYLITNNRDVRDDSLFSFAEVSYGLTKGGESPLLEVFQGKFEDKV